VIWNLAPHVEGEQILKVQNFYAVSICLMKIVLSHLININTSDLKFFEINMLSRILDARWLD
jgi:hypothetical protein